MQISESVQRCLAYYATENLGVRLNLARLFMHGAVGGTGNLLILAVDQGFEHGPSTFLTNPQGFSPDYHFQLAIEGQVSAYTAPLHWLKAGVAKHIYEVPIIAKLNHANKLQNHDPDQAVIASVYEALEIGAIGIGFTLYPGSKFYNEQLEELHEISSVARKVGLFTLVWAYPRGGVVQNTDGIDHRLSLDAIAYSAHMACLAGAHIVKVNCPKATLLQDHELYIDTLDSLTGRMHHIVQCCFDGQRAVLFSGGALKEKGSLLAEIQAIKKAKATGSIIGRNIFQRPKVEALQLINQIIQVYQDVV